MQRIGDNIFYLSKVLKSLIEGKLNSFGIGVGQLQILMTLMSSEGREISQKELVEILSVDKGNISRSITKLLNKGYIVTSINKEKVKLIELTGIGKEIMNDILPLFTKINETMMEGIDKNQLELFHDILNQMITNLEAN